MTVSQSFAGDIRLVGGSVLSEGRVEIYFNRKWWAICGYTWDPLDAAVACRQLGFTEALNTYSSSSQNDFGMSSLTRWHHGLKCTGNESKLIDCLQDMDPEIDYLCDFTFHQYPVAGVVCKNDSRQALPGGILSHTKSLLMLFYYNGLNILKHKSHLPVKRFSCRSWSATSCYLMSVMLYMYIGVLRLVDGSHRREGRVEIFSEGKWETMCYHGNIQEYTVPSPTTIDTAHVIC